MANLCKNKHIKQENYDLWHRNYKIINPNFVLLKVASDKKFGQHFPYHSAGIIWYFDPHDKLTLGSIFLSLYFEPPHGKLTTLISTKREGFNRTKISEDKTLPHEKFYRFAHF
jgi:hypothetical protein